MGGGNSLSLASLDSSLREGASDYPMTWRATSTLSLASLA